MYSVTIIENDVADAVRLAQMIEQSPLAERLTLTGTSRLEEAEPLAAAERASADPDAKPCAPTAAERELVSLHAPAPSDAAHAVPPSPASPQAPTALSELASLAGGALPDILFVDVRLSDDEDAASGIDLIHRFIPQTASVQVIYVSAYLEYAPAAYHTRHTWFLSKPVDPAELNAALARAVAALDAERAEPLLVHQGNSLVRIAPHRVLYVESDRRKVRIHERDRTVEAYARISDMEARLPKQFARCHKSFLVNLAFVSELRGRELILANGEHLPVSQRCRKSLAERLVTFIGRAL